MNRTQRVCVYPAQRSKTSAQCEEEHLTARASRSKNNDLRMKFIFVFPRTRTPEVYLPSRFKRFVEQNSNKNHLWNSGTTNVLWSFTASQKLPNSPLCLVQKVRLVHKLVKLVACESFRHVYASISVWVTSQHKHSCFVALQ